MRVTRAFGDRHGPDYELGRGGRIGSLPTAFAGVALVGYGVVFLALTFYGTGFELGVGTLDGVTPADLDAVMNYIDHLHVATAVFVVGAALAYRELQSGRPPADDVWRPLFGVSTVLRGATGGGVRERRFARPGWRFLRRGR